MTSEPGTSPEPGSPPEPPAGGRSAPTDPPAGSWTPVTRGAVAAVAWTLAWADTPGSGRARTALAAWCVPLLVPAVLLSRGRYHRAGGAVTTTVRRPVPHGAQVRRFVIGFVVYLVVGTALGSTVDGAGPLVVGAILFAYALSVAIVRGTAQWPRRSVSERRGPVRTVGIAYDAWELGRVVPRDGDLEGTMPVVAELIDQVVPPGRRVVTAARSDAEQVALETLGFTDVRGEHGFLELTTPVTR